MDCQQWAEGVIAALHQGSSNQPSFPEFLLPKSSIISPSNQRQKRRNRSNGSTFLEVPAAPRGAVQDASHQNIVAASPSRTLSRASEVMSESNDFKYQRRLRKKPRADLYERAAPKPIKRLVRRTTNKSRTAKHGEDTKEHNNWSSAVIQLKPSLPVTYPDRLTVGVI
jgi:hypothetical protein